MDILPDNAQIVFYKAPINMHKSFDSLLSIIYTELDVDLTEKTYVLFLNRKRNRTKIIYFDHGHVSMLAMRLAGSMIVDFSSTEIINKNDLCSLIKNLRTKKKRLPPT